MTAERTPRRVLITGVGGAGGSYLAEHVVAGHPQVEVHGTVRWHGSSVDHLSAIRGKVKLHTVDLLDFASLVTALRDSKPDVVFHLASQANVPLSFKTPAMLLSNNVIGTANLFEAIRTAGIDPVVQLSGTSSMYGKVDPKDVPLKESAPLNPVSPYGVSKVAQDQLGFTYFTAYGMKVVRTRIFGYLSPRRADLFATAFAKQIAWVEAGLANELTHGNLDSVRSVIDVRDAVAAYWVAAVKGRFGEAYNIGGTTHVKVGDLLERLLGMAKKKIPVKADPALMRPSDVTDQIPDTSKFTKETGWKPVHSFEDSLQFLLSYWRDQAKAMS